MKGLKQGFIAGSLGAASRTLQRRRRWSLKVVHMKITTPILPGPGQPVAVAVRPPERARRPPSVRPFSCWAGLEKRL